MQERERENCLKKDVEERYEMNGRERRQWMNDFEGEGELGYR